MNAEELRRSIESLPRLRLTGEQLDAIDPDPEKRFYVDWDEYDEFIRLDDVWAALDAARTASVAGLDGHAKDDPDDHAEDCQDCGAHNIVWFTANELWNRVMPDGGMLCVPCFVRRAEAGGFVPTGWELRPEGRDSDPEKGLPSIESLAVELWTEFGYAQPDDDSSKPPRLTEPDDPYWLAAARRVREGTARHPGVTAGSRQAFGRSARAALEADRNPQETERGNPQ